MSHKKRSSASLVVAQMCMCVVGIYICFAWWSLKQERVATQTYDMADGTKARFRSPFVINLIQSACATFVALALLLLSSQPLIAVGSSGATYTRQWIGKAIMIGFCCTFASPFGYAAMSRLSYPIVLTMKMGKMLPVVIVGTLWHRTKYSVEKYWTVLLITCGVISFSMLEESHEHADTGRSSSLLGLALVFVNLIIDGFTCSTQDVLVKKFHWSGNRVMLTTNTFAVLWSAAALIAFELLPSNGITTRELSNSIAFFVQQPDALVDVALMGLTNALGQFFIFQTIALFGTLTVTAMTLVRKVGSVLLSIYINNHQVSDGQWLSLAVVLLGVLLETRINIREKSAGKGAAPGAPPGAVAERTAKEKAG